MTTTTSSTLPALSIMTSLRPCLHSFLCLLTYLARVRAFVPQTQCDLSPLNPLAHQTRTCPLSSHTSPQDTANTPWTTSPRCVVPHSIGLGQKFCLYTDAAYNLGTGISIITLEDHAASLIEAVRDPIPAWTARHHLAARGMRDPGYEDHVPYREIAMEGKGRGVVATRRISRFETIMVGYPAMVIDNTFLPAEGVEAPVENWRMFDHALEQLADKERFLVAAHSRGDDVHVVEDILRTNAFGVYIEDRDAKAFFPEIARLNHACSPNAYPQLVMRDLSMRAVATRDIEPGEEITISYIQLGMPKKHRIASMGNWGFNCTCSLCAAGPEEQHASDDRRERLADIYDLMKQQKTTAKLGSLRELAAEFEELVRLEQLEVRWGEYYQLFMVIFFHAGDLETAISYGELSLRHSEIFADPDGVFCSGLRRDLKILDQVKRQRAGGR